MSDTKRNNEGLSEDDPATVQFLLVELAEIGEFWRQTDSRIDSAINISLTAGAVVVPSTLLLLQLVLDPRQRVFSLVIVSFAFLMLSLLLMGWLLRASILRVEYTRAASFIKQYFIRNDCRLADYPFRAPDHVMVYSEHFRSSAYATVIVVVTIGGAVCVGIAVASALWLSTSLVLPLDLVIGVGAGLVYFAALLFVSGNRMRQHGASLDLRAVFDNVLGKKTIAQ